VVVKQTNSLDDRGIEKLGSNSQETILSLGVVVVATATEMIGSTKKSTICNMMAQFQFSFPPLLASSMFLVICSSFTTPLTEAFSPSSRNTIGRWNPLKTREFELGSDTFSSSSLTDSALWAKPYFADFAAQHDNEKTDPLTTTIFETTHSHKNIGRGKTAIVAGATGYIGRAVVRECLSRGYTTIALVRNSTYILETEEGLQRYGEPFGLNPGEENDQYERIEAIVLQCDVCKPKDVRDLMKCIASGTDLPPSTKMQQKQQQPPNNPSIPKNIDLVISCLASASGTESEVYAIDYSATLNLLNSGRDRTVNARHFLLLSAFCCRNPLLKLQQAKLKFESELAKQGDMTWSVIRPTAFFKSVSGQFESILDGNSYVLFGDGAVTRCNPISEEDLAVYMLDCALENNKERRWGKILNVGGPDEPLTNKMLGEMMFKAIGKPPKFVYVPTWIFDLSIDMIASIAKKFPSQKWEDALETAKIGKYYAVEDMLTTEPNEKFGTMTMMSHFEKIVKEGQDPFTPVRATAVISKTLEALPAISISLPVGFGLLTRPEVMDTVVASSPLSNVPLLIAQLNDNIFS